jgi:hypothetical protein
MNIDDLMSQVPVDSLAAQLGVAPEEAEQAARQALPALLAGMNANAQDPGGAKSLEEAVQQHDGSVLDGGIDFGKVDTADGEKIVGHVFGDNTDSVINQLGGKSGGSGMMAKLLPILAPIVMAWLAKQFMGGGKAGAGGGASGGGGIGDILGGLLGGGGAGGAGGAGGIEDILGGLLGGGRKA